MASLFKDRKGAFSSLFKSGDAYPSLFSKEGAVPPQKRLDARLAGLGQDEPPPEGPPPEGPPPEGPPPEGPPTKPKPPPFFTREYAGVPAWLLGVFLLGFAYAFKKKKTAAEEKAGKTTKQRKKK